MRWFWLLVGLLGVGAVVVVVTGGGDAGEKPALERAPAARLEPFKVIEFGHQKEVIVIDMREVVEDAEPVVENLSAVENEARSGVEDVRIMGDGSLMLAGRYRVTGRGTPEEPYTVTWALLKSAEEGYSPVVGKTEIPGWIEILGGMYVRIDGFMMNPTLEEEVGEFLLMKNSWDACCLGLPPTPYDSMEVALDRVVKMPELKHARASVTGRLGVVPSLVAGRFLTGLYTLDDARAEFRAGL